MDVTKQIQAMEARLQEAMLSSDTDELDRLISDRAIIVGPDGRLVSKSDDLAAHKEKILTLVELTPQQVLIHPIPGSVIVFVVASLRGVYHGQPFSGLFRYTRTWYLEESTWRIIAVHISPLPHGPDTDVPLSA